MIFDTPPGLLALLAIPAILLLYLLKQKNTDYTVSSLYLWKDAIRDLEANTPWQRLRKNLLMFLQILAALLLALLLSGIKIPTGNAQEESVLLVIDCSLSMQSTDMPPNRFQAAVEDASKLVAGGRQGITYTLVAAGETPYIVLRGSTDKNRVLDELKSLRVNDAPEDTEAAAKLADSLIRQDPGVKVYWFSDGSNPLAAENVEYRSYNRNGDNFAVTALTWRRLNHGESMTVLGRIGNYATKATELAVSLYTDGTLFDARSVTVDAGKTESLYWQNVPGDVSQLSCRIDNEDSLLLDNVATEAVYPSRTRKVLLVTEKNIYLEKMFSILENVDLYKTGVKDGMEQKGYDLYVYDGVVPERLPADGQYMFFNPPVNDYFSSVGQAQYPDLKAAKHELFDGLGSEVSFAAVKAALYQLPDGARPLMETDGGIAAFEGYSGKNRMMVFGFDLHETNLPVQSFFPVLITRAAELLAPAEHKELTAVYAGDRVQLSVVPEAEEAAVITPDGVRHAIAPPFPVPAFDDTTKTGLYTVEQRLASGTVTYAFYVNAPSEREFAASKQAAAEEGDRRQTDSRQPGNASGILDLKLPLLWLLLAILLIEWRVYTNGNAI